MKKTQCLFLLVTVAIVLLTAACAGQDDGSPTAAVGTGAPEETSSPAPAETDANAIASPQATVNTTATIETATLGAEESTPAADATQTPGGQAAGVEPILVECQYCIDGMAHALLVLPDTATFETVTDTAAVSTPGPDTGCNTVDTYNGRQVVICRAQESTSLNLNICRDGNNCTPLLVELQSCPNTLQPGLTNTPEAEETTAETPTIGATDTPSVITATSTP